MRSAARETGLTPTGSTRLRRVIVAGGSGLIGRHLTAALLARGDEVLVLSRDPRATASRLPDASVLEWRPGRDGPWQEELEAADGMVDLAGAPFFTRLRGRDYQREVLGTRRAASAALAHTIARTSVAPRTLVSGSSILVYGFRHGDKILTERTQPDIAPLSTAAVELERLAAQAEVGGTRVVLLRTGMVLANEGGGFGQFTQPFGPSRVAPVMPGSQWCSWIHIQDVVGLILAALDDERIRGPLNVTAPNPVRNVEFAFTVSDALGVPMGPNYSAEELQIALGKVAITITQGQRVVPARALELGYEFRYPTLAAAVWNLVGRDFEATTAQTELKPPPIVGN